MYHRVQFTLFHCFTLSPHHHRYRPCPQGRYHHCYCHNYYDHNKHYQDNQYHFLFFDYFPGCIDEGSAAFCQRFRKFCAHYGTANHRYLANKCQATCGFCGWLHSRVPSYLIHQNDNQFINTLTSVIVRLTSSSSRKPLPSCDVGR